MIKPRESKGDPCALTRFTYVLTALSLSFFKAWLLAIIQIQKYRRVFVMLVQEK